MDDRQLRTAWQNRQIADRTTTLGEPLALFMKHTLARRVKQLGALASIWDEVIPEEIREHTALETFKGGTLSVVVDSAPHRFQLEMLLKSGLQRMLAERFPGALTKVKITPGQFSSIDLEGSPRYAF